jgi:hypothetical protein
MAVEAPPPQSSPPKAGKPRNGGRMGSFGRDLQEVAGGHETASLLRPYRDGRRIMQKSSESGLSWLRRIEARPPLAGRVGHVSEVMVTALRARRRKGR